MDGHPALPEPLRLAAAHGTFADASIRILLGYDDDTLLGCGFLSSATDGSHSLHLVVDPTVGSGPEAQAVSNALIDRALEEPEGEGILRLWAMRATGDDDATAVRHGFGVDRELLQMRIPLPLPPDIVAGTVPVTVRPFEPGRDEEAWLSVNNRAFAGHPEQGGWTLAQLQERLAADWVELDGFLIADAPDGHGIIGSCWTKIHRHSVPVLGEIYVISVDPSRHGQGWGKALTVAGLNWLSGQGITTGMLYTGGDNTAAIGALPFPRLHARPRRPGVRTSGLSRTAAAWPPGSLSAPRRRWRSPPRR